jgi:hypothetical protein
MNLGVYRCQTCADIWIDGIPPLWLEDWPTCCGQKVNLAFPLVTLPKVVIGPEAEEHD